MTLNESVQTTRDNIGIRDTTQDLILIGPFNERVVINEGPTLVTTLDTVGEGVWGIGFGDGTDNDGDWDEAGYTWQASDEGEFDATATYERVVNPANKFKERFRYSTFNDTTNTTASFDTSEYNVNFDKNEVWRTLQTFKNSESIVSVKPVVSLHGGKTQFVVSGSSKIVTITEGKDVQYQ